ncbi:amyloid beta A4 precursor protein-binding family B member 1-interacting protein isoform X2 [Eleutherodactylus coqui]|uniref:amyloid beta A4 precursor protein-binding family B member 1-interacting protein isoform X2 n=1 Tax=Eleutherodactylus coqui TaxID=57060 RepID=UPI003461CA38
MEEAYNEIDDMFNHLLGEMDLLTKSLGPKPEPPAEAIGAETEMNFSFGFKDLSESLGALEDNDLDALVADLLADGKDAELKENSQSYDSAPPLPTVGTSNNAYHHYDNLPGGSIDDLSSLPPPPPSSWEMDLPPPPCDPEEPKTQDKDESKAKVDKIKLALDKMKVAKVKKLIVKVHMTDSSTKTLMVDEVQTVRDILDNLFEKTHCDCTVEWCLYEESPELQLERFFEDHENIVEILSDWTRDSENKIYFVKKSEKYALFKNPQQNLCGPTVIVPDLEGVFYLKEDGKKSWKKRCFLLRASGIYYVPKGKTKTSRDLASFIQFENVNVYYGMQYKVKYKAPTDHCFVLKHPQIQKESPYIKYLCCEDPWVLHQWVTGIRIAKYGKTLYDNYKTAVHKAGLSSHWSTLSNPSGPSTAGKAQGNGQVAQNITSVSSSFSDAWKRGEAAKGTQLNENSKAEVIKQPTPKLAKKPPSTPIRSSSAIPPSPPTKAKPSGNMPPPPPPLKFVPPEALQPDDDFLPPPPPDFFDLPPDFLPPPPPLTNSVSGYAPLPPPPQLVPTTGTSAAPLPPPPPPSASALPPPPPPSASALPPPPPPSASAPPPPPPPSASAPPPPPPPSASAPPQLPVKKQPPNPPRRSGNTSVMSKGLSANGSAGGEPDFMSDLMKALQKKRENTN